MPSDFTLKPDPVSAAFSELVRELATRAAGDQAKPDGFERAVAFRRKVLDLAERWTTGKPPRMPRGAGKAEG